MIIELYTPAHGLFPDTLIMYGLVSPLRTHTDIEFDVVGHGTFFHILIKDIDRERYSELLSKEMDDNKEGVRSLLISNLRLIQKKSEKGLIKCFEMFKDEKEIFRYLDKCSKPGHAEEEGRYPREEESFTAWLPLYPQSGKYATRLFKYDPGRAYKMCPFCISLATLGFAKSVIAIKGLDRRERKINSILFTFEGKVRGDTIRKLLTYIDSEAYNREVKNDRSIRRGADILPLSTFTSLLLAFLTGELIAELYYSEASFKAQSLTFEVSRVVQIRGYNEAVIDKLLYALTQLSQNDCLDELRKLSKKLLYGEEVSALDFLYGFLENRTASDLYKASRSITKALERGFGKDFAQKLALLIREA